ncbi:hypothetical protein OPTIMUS_6 [Mycobacterium phage Optimus]|uniref:Terminase small subunit n=4 Tax=Omegavirus TaxID=1623292 RepID=A0A3S9UB88_9CAUD|nr:terminase small subunit [Mycobacterium phage Thibault]YP_009123961.1 terminase small subunit [Mycobacterium phage Minerva]YP_009590862.1 terminase small subunit [Mycobacterium phage Optimus]YP_009636176.1 terminase small subunit [Mycobacterium phage Baka]ATN89050.1 hypothetical protein SEA_DMPSTRDIVER_8 [Mycobacterium phage DmpstrDiver]AXF51494.1 hypothetical protein CONSTELLA_4 [Mycobacterium phage Constella]AXQ52469.1 hypothetical protein SEA_ERICMILLARD_9 [Mycobacterium phage EricMillar
MALSEGLGPRGSEVFEALTDGRPISAAQRALALNAARLADTLDRIESELAHAPLTVINSQGTETIHPLISEARMLTGALSQILAKMGVSALPEPESKEKRPLDVLAERRAQRQAARASNAENSL